MLRSRIILIVISVALVAVIFSLPKVVVDNDSESIEGGAESVKENTVDNSNVAASTDDVMNESHSGTIPAEIRKEIDRLRNTYLTAENQENSLIFADSLAKVFRELNKLDSAAKYVELSQEDKEVIGNAYYEAFSFAADVDKANRLASKTQEYFVKVLEEDPDNNSVKIKLAMTYVSSDNPMKGISMLLDVVKENPDNEEALFNLGILSIQSGQYDKAADRFEKILSINPDNVQAKFYLALSLMNAGQKSRAEKLFTEIKNTSNDEQLLAAVESYLNEL